MTFRVLSSSSGYSFNMFVIRILWAVGSLCEIFEYSTVITFPSNVCAGSRNTFDTVKEDALDDS